MKLLLDECTPKRLKNDFVGHNVFTVDDAGFKGLKNGDLLRAATNAGFEVLITVDQNIQHQQNIALSTICVLILIAKSNRYDHLQPLITKALELLTTIKSREIIIVERTS
jgi:predicted nuclease of predicted toxin-antitoxin system